MSDNPGVYNPDWSSADPARFQGDPSLLPPIDPSLEQQTIRYKGQGRRALPHELYTARVAVVAALAAEGYTRRQIADALQMSISGVDWCKRKARAEGKLVDGAKEMLELVRTEGLPLAVEGLLFHLRKRDKGMITRVLEAQGILPKMAAVKNGDQPSGQRMGMAFQFVFTMPDGTTAPMVDAGQVIDTKALPGEIVGTPKP